jgi:hypothetical protein
MCPALAHDFKKEVCDGQSTFLGKAVGPCNFVNKFKDERGWIFFVRRGLGDSNYKTFFKKPGQNTEGHGYRNLPWRKSFREAQQVYRNLPWRKSFREAQEDLNKLALKKGWVII